jgi:hypothetical protein
MDSLLGIALVGVWVVISVVALLRAYGSRIRTTAGDRHAQTVIRVRLSKAR